jgi:hypothetical protein
LKEAEQNLYPGCKKFSKLSFIVHLYHYYWLRNCNLGTVSFTITDYQVRYSSLEHNYVSWKFLRMFQRSYVSLKLC